MQTFEKRIERLERVVLERERMAYWYDYADWLVLTREHGTERATELLAARGADPKLLHDIAEILANSRHEET